MKGQNKYKGNIAFFIATQKGFCGLEKCLKEGYASNIKFVVSFKEVNVEKSYDEDISHLCSQNDIEFYLWKDVKNRIIDLCVLNNITIAFAIGWRFLITTEINNAVKDNLIVFHDSLLPKYRGFSPTPTAIICGEKTVGITALVASEIVDQGDIVLQKEIDVYDEDYIADIIRKQCIVCENMIVEILEKIALGTLVRKKQDETEASYCIWRNLEDCEVDWNKSSLEIRNLVRAVSSPYAGAYSYYKGNKIIIRRVEMVDDLEFVIRQSGKIWSITENKPIIVCGSGMLKISEAYYDNGCEVIFDTLRERL